jgi:DNA polymerase-3 subunit epsilon
MRLASGGKLVDCCRDDGVGFDSEAHHALNDARAAAELLACLFREEPRLIQNLSGGSMIAWPELSPATRTLITRQERRVQRDTVPVFISRLATERRRVDAPPDENAKAAYLEILDRVLEDRRLEDTEIESLITLATNYGLTHADVMDCHRNYVMQLVKIAMADRVISEAERSDLSTVIRLLGLQESAIEESLESLHQTTSHSVSAKSDHINSLRGMRICFTGELRSTYRGRPVTRELAESLSRQAGLEIVDNVTKKLDLLVVADPDSLSGKAKKARQYGIRIIHEVAFWPMIGIIES